MDDHNYHEQLHEYARHLGSCLQRAGIKIVTAESCTGGGVSYMLTAVSGSSNWFERGFVVYSNVAKQQMLGVSAEVLSSYGAVSEETAMEMARGAIQYSAADVAIAVTGIAGPGGGTEEKPVGTVCFAWCTRDGQSFSTRTRFEGDRARVRDMAIGLALQGALDLLAMD